VLETNIIIADPTSLNHQWGGPRTIGDSIYTYVPPLHPGVRFVHGVGLEGRELAVWPTTDQIVYAANNTGTAATLGTKIAQQFLDAGFIINMAIMKSHNDGPTGCFKNHYGAISGQRHGPIYGNSTPNYYANTIEPMGHQELVQKEMLFIIDAIYGSPTPNADPVKWTMAPFNGSWPSSVFMSQDPVAIDSVNFDFLNAEFGLPANTDNDLYEAASVTNAKGQKQSGTVYQLTAGSTATLGSLGVFEHWNNATAKQYSRNLNPATGTGIELVSVALDAVSDGGVATDAGTMVDAREDQGTGSSSGTGSSNGTGASSGTSSSSGTGSSSGTTLSSSGTTLSSSGTGSSTGGTGSTSGNQQVADGGAPTTTDSGQGCGCRLADAQSERPTAPLAMVGVMLGLALRRRKDRR
jgi:MYXO-CTERM domain-containing protein